MSCLEVVPRHVLTPWITGMVQCHVWNWFSDMFLPPWITGVVQCHVWKWFSECSYPLVQCHVVGHKYLA